MIIIIMLTFVTDVIKSVLVGTKCAGAWAFCSWETAFTDSHCNRLMCVTLKQILKQKLERGKVQMFVLQVKKKN